MANLLSQHILNKNFTSIRFKIYLRNETSHTVFAKSEFIFLKELRDDGIVIELPLNICQKGHSLTLFFLPIEAELKSKIPVSGRLKEASFEAMVKVEKLETLLSVVGSVSCDLHFTQYDVDLWRKVLAIFSKNQEQVNGIFANQHKVRDEE
ncbi:MAG: hypothetical protein KBD76_05810 [Bacteriovorax sp.]|nr:hypothetical protein [Bacteriovorax sp.]